MVDERSAGAVVFYKDGLEPQYLLLHYTSGHWDFPKGNIETGETEKQAALREIWEETGICDVDFLEGFRMTIEYRYRHGRRLVQKEVVLYLAQTKTRQATLSHEHIGFVWKTYEGAMQQLTYRNAKNLLASARNFLQQHSLAYR